MDKFEGELRAISSLGIPGEGLLAYWEFDEFEGTSAHSTNGRIGVLTNFDGSQWVEGKRGNALSFDGTNDYVVLPVGHIPSLQILKLLLPFGLMVETSFLATTVYWNLVRLEITIGS